MSDSQPNAKPVARKDPKSRPVHAASFGGQIINCPPDMNPVWVSKQDGHDNGHEYYSSIGYEIVRHDPKQPLKIFMCKEPKAGEPYFFRDMVLMWCTKERKAEIDQYGPDGNSGYNMFSAYMKKIESNQIENPNRVRGMSEQYKVEFDEEVFR